MKNNEYHEFYCPRCGKPAMLNTTVSTRKYAMQALATFYYLCGSCRLMFISKQMVRRAVSAWWHENKLEQVASFRYFYDEALKYLYGDILDYHKKIGYKLARFKQQSPK